MQKKQSPVLLIVVGVVVLVGIGLTNSTDIWAKLFTPPPPKQEDKPGATQEVNTKDIVKADISKGSKSKDPEEAPKATGIPEEPSIYQAKFKRYDPTPNETSTTSQWYRKESSEQERKEQLEKKRGY